MAELCRRCEHPVSSHGDRAVVPCIVLVKDQFTTVERYVPCHCTGWQQP